MNLRLAAIVFALLATVGGGRADVSDGPVLVVSAGARRTPPRDSTAAASLVLASLADADLARLAVDLETAADRADARAMPLLDDVEDVDPQETLLPWRTTLAGSLLAASALASGVWTSGDGALSVRLATSCDEAKAGESCLDAFAPVGPQADRARFLAWPVAYAVVLHVVDAAQREKVVGALRGRVSSPTTHIALALDAAPSAPDVRLRLAAAARRLASRAPDDVTLSAFASPYASPARPDALSHAPAGTVMVVPRLSSLARRDDFLDEIRAALAAAGVAGAARFVTPS